MSSPERLPGSDGVMVVALGSDRRTVAREPASEVAPLAARVGATWLALDPLGCHTLALPARPIFVSDGGCAFSATGADGVLEREPWIRRCPR